MWPAVKIFEEEGQDDSVDVNDIEEDKDIYYVDNIHDTVMVSLFDNNISETK